MNQREFLVAFEKLCGVKQPIFLNTSDTWEIPDRALVYAKDLTVEHAIGRYRLTLKNSEVCEIWIDVDNHDGIAWKQYREQRLVPAINKLNSLGISNDYVFPKVSGTGVHLHVFISDLPASVDVNELFQKSATETVDARSKVERQKIREFGAQTSTKQGFCGYVSVANLLKARTLPSFKEEPVYPELKLFKCNSDFLFSLSLVKADRQQQTLEKDVIVDYERDGDFNQLFKCPLVASLSKKAQTEHHLNHNERLFLMCQFIHFGEDSRRKLHEIMSQCSDYDEAVTQGFIDHAMQNSYHPITCKWAKDMRLGCPTECRGSGGKSPVKFAWTPLALEDLLKEFRKILLLSPEDDDALKILLATMLDPKIEGELVWIFFIAPAAWGKTVILKSLHDPKWSRLEDSITPRTFISGKTVKDKKTGEDVLVEGLLPKLHGKTLIIKEFTTELMHGEEIRNDVFGQLRAIHDRYFSKTFGSIDVDKIPEHWKHVKMGFIAGCVPYIDMYGTLNVLLGERYLKLRMREPNREAATRMAVLNAKDIETMQVTLNKKVKRFLANVTINPEIERLDPSKECLDALVNLAEFIVQLRKPITTTKDNLGVKIYDYEELTELPTRVAAQLWKLAKMLMIVMDKKKFTDEIYRILVRLACDTVPQERLGIILTLYVQEKPIPKTRLAKLLNWEERKTYEHVKQMKYIGLIHADENDDYCVNDYIKQIMTKANILSRPHSGRGVPLQSLANNIINIPTPTVKALQYVETTENVHTCGATDELSTEEVRRQCYGDGVKLTSYLENRCMTCGRVPVGKNFELLDDGYAELVIKVCRQCYLRMFYGGAFGSSRWMVLT